MSNSLLQTPLHSWHTPHGGRMVDFAGWEMPVQYTSIVSEHHAVRNQAGLFDISHMGRLFFTGPDAGRFLDALVTCDVASLEVGQIRYGLMTNTEGGILDDVLVYRFPERYLLVVNASNRDKICEWLKPHQSNFDAAIDDQTLTTAMLALQGPNSEAILSKRLSDHLDLAGMAYYTGQEIEIEGEPVVVSRTGYTGEDGFEVIVKSDLGLAFWEQLMADGESHGLVSAGLGCRDTLRLEAAMPLYGHELSEDMDPFTAKLGFAVKLDGADFVGRSTLQSLKESATRTRVGLVLEGKRIAREHSRVFAGDRECGVITSGTYSPTLEKSLAMGYVDRDVSKLGMQLDVEIRNQKIPAEVVKLPFYRRPK